LNRQIISDFAEVKKKGWMKKCPIETRSDVLENDAVARC
jgi:hypothetical protein